MRPFRDYTGQKVGSLFVIARVGSRSYGNSPEARRKRPSGFVTWLVRCGCGVEKVLTSNALRGAKSCGCMWTRKKGRIVRGYEPGQAARNYVLAYYKSSATLRDLVWSLSDSQFYALTQELCHYCGEPPSKIYKTRSGSGEFIYSGVDRKDNSQGYILGNVVSCCETCNLAKRDLTYDEFVSWLVKAGRHQMENSHR